jgi:hypothetical protein
VERGLQADACGSFRIREDAAESLYGCGSELLVLIAPEQDFLFTGAAESSAEVGRIAAPVEYGIAMYAGRFGRGDDSGTRRDHSAVDWINEQRHDALRQTDQFGWWYPAFKPEPREEVESAEPRSFRLLT